MVRIRLGVGVGVRVGARASARLGLRRLALLGEREGEVVDGCHRHLARYGGDMAEI
jgi:hypothetical protein